MHNIATSLTYMSTQGKSQHDDPIFSLQFLNVLHMADICAKFEKNLDSTSPGGVFEISTDGDNRMEPKVKTQKNP